MNSRLGCIWSWRRRISRSSCYDLVGKYGLIEPNLCCSCLFGYCLGRYLCGRSLGVFCLGGCCLDSCCRDGCTLSGRCCLFAFYFIGSISYNYSYHLCCNNLLRASFEVRLFWSHVMLTQSLPRAGIVSVSSSLFSKLSRMERTASSASMSIKSRLVLC